MIDTRDDQGFRIQTSEIDGFTFCRRSALVIKIGEYTSEFAILNFDAYGKINKVSMRRRSWRGHGYFEKGLTHQFASVFIGNLDDFLCGNKSLYHPLIRPYIKVVFVSFGYIR